jgi:hypothetical protein
VLKESNSEQQGSEIVYSDLELRDEARERLENEDWRLKLSETYFHKLHGAGQCLQSQLTKIPESFSPFVASCFLHSIRAQPTLVTNSG